MKNILIILFTLLLFTGCVAGPNTMSGEVNSAGEIAGFWHGLLHGLLAPIMFIVSLFNDQVNVYEVFNNGGWYNFGFLLGASIIFGGSGAGASKGRNSSDD